LIKVLAYPLIHPNRALKPFLLSVRFSSFCRVFGVFVWLDTSCFHFVIKHKSLKNNQGADALLRRCLLLFQCNSNVLGFERLKSLCMGDPNFGELYEACPGHPRGHFMNQEGYFFKGTQLCVPKCGTREILLREVSGGSLEGHFGEDKTYTMAKDHYYWPQHAKGYSRHH